MADELLIAGAGLNGLAAAVALAGPRARTPVRLRILDAGDPADADAQAQDGRAYAVTASSRRLFEAIGVWDRIEPHAQPMRSIIVTDSRLEETARPVLLYFSEPPQPGAPTAYLVENRHLFAALLEAANASDSIRISANTAVSSFAFTGQAARIGLAGGETVSSPLLIAADGRESPARRAAGIKTVGWPYGQSAIVLTVEHERPHHGQAEEHFLPAGPFAILPLPGNRSSLVWTEETREARRIMALERLAFQGELQRRFGPHLGAVKPVGTPRSYPLSMQLARALVGDRLALIGDAAHVVHPIAGLGFNLGLRDIAALAEVVVDDLRLGLDPGGAATLQRYQTWRRLDTVMVAGVTEGLNRLFTSQMPGARFARDAGLQAVDRLSGLKSALMGEAAGLYGRLPRLLQGEAL